MVNEKLGFVKTTEQMEEISLIEWDAPYCFVKKKRFYPKIYIGSNSIPDGYNAVMIELDGRVKSNLDWEESLAYAETLVEKGYKILWFLNLGLFSELSFNLYTHTQLQTLSLSIEHFIDKVWKKYHLNSLGLCLYKGEMDFSSSFKWDELQLANFQSWLKEGFETPDLIEKSVVSFEAFSQYNVSIELLQLYACDVAIDFLDMLIQPICEEIECFAMVDCSKISNCLLQARLLSSERCDRLHFIVKNSSVPPQGLAWDGEITPYGYCGAGNESTFKEEKPSIGICIPEVSMINSKFYIGLESAIAFLIEKKKDFRVVSEANLTVEWDGLDILIVNRSGLSPYGFRKLQGFCAAGGLVVSVEGALGLSKEVSFEEWRE